MAEVDTIDVKDAAAATQTVATISKLIKTIGLPSDAAVITDANGTVQQYLRGLIKQWIAGTLVIGAGENHAAQVSGYGFDVVVTPTVTNGAYSAGDIMGALMTFNVARANDKPIIIQEIQVALKAAVTPSFLVVVFNADPSSTTKTDNAAYSLNAADVFKVRAAIPVNALGGYLTDHGTPNTIRVGNLAIPMKPESGGTNIYVLLIDLTGVTLTSTSDIQVRLAGVGA